jgi:hypothetical protein
MISEAHYGHTHDLLSIPVLIGLNNILFRLGEGRSCELPTSVLLLSDSEFLRLQSAQSNFLLLAGIHGDGSTTAKRQQGVGTGPTNYYPWVMSHYYIDPCHDFHFLLAYVAASGFELGR